MARWRADAAITIVTMVAALAGSCVAEMSPLATLSAARALRSQGRSLLAAGQGLERGLLPMRGGGGDLCYCKFEVRVPNTKPGDTVLLLGSTEYLHDWDKGRAITLTTTPQDFPWWSADVAIPVGHSVEFKFAIRSDTGVLAWEPQQGNRHCIVPDDVAHTLTFDFGEQAALDSRAAYKAPREPEPAATEQKATEESEHKVNGLLAGVARALSPLRRAQHSPLSPPPAAGIRKSGHDFDIASFGGTSGVSSPRKEVRQVSSPTTPERMLQVKHQSAPAPGATAGEKLTRTREETPAPVAEKLTQTREEALQALKQAKASLAVPAAQEDSASQETDAVAVVPVVAEDNDLQHVSEPKRQFEVMKSVLVNLLRVMGAPISLPIWILYASFNAVMTLLGRVFASLNALFFEADPDRFERMLINNINVMQGSMSQMNVTLTGAMNTVDRQMNDVTRLEKLWQVEHQKYLSALEQAKIAETELQRSTREFREELVSAKKAAADAKQAHEEQVRMVKVEMERMLCDAQKAFSSDVSRLECQMNLTQHELGEVRSSGMKTAYNIIQHDRDIKSLNDTQRLETARLGRDLDEAQLEIKRVAVKLNVSKAEILALAATGSKTIEEVAAHESKLKSLHDEMVLGDKQLAHELGATAREVTRVSGEINATRTETATLHNKITSAEVTMGRLNHLQRVMQANMPERTNSFNQAEHVDRSNGNKVGGWMKKANNAIRLLANNNQGKEPTTSSAQLPTASTQEPPLPDRVRPAGAGLKLKIKKSMSIPQEAWNAQVAKLAADGDARAGSAPNTPGHEGQRVCDPPVEKWHEGTHIDSRDVSFVSDEGVSPNASGHAKATKTSQQGTPVKRANGVRQEPQCLCQSERACVCPDEAATAQEDPGAAEFYTPPVTPSRVAMKA